MYIIKRIILNFFDKILYSIEHLRAEKKRQLYKFDKSILFGDVEFIGPNIFINEGTYINKGSTISSGNNSKVVIGKYCAIGRYTHISSKTHGLEIPTHDEQHKIEQIIEKDITIGNYVWIGDKVFIKEGIQIADYAIIAANSVVNRNVEKFEIVGGVPIKHIRFNEKHYLFMK